MWTNEAADVSYSHHRKTFATSSQKWVEKIQEGEFTDFNELPTEKGKVKGAPNSLDGQILVIQAADLTGHWKLISSFATWVQFA